MFPLRQEVEMQFDDGLLCNLSVGHGRCYNQAHYSILYTLQTQAEDRCYQVFKNSFLALYSPGNHIRFYF